ncbi:prenyltransferase/squalene oxidase repeat-containing protein [Botrimarina colliarenosi]|uniref:prenyltransferase/squalene oxidase repeat-containing protein n=1 Tax=Botrimarina colliarenosi TaxID=2528001 RepID=UPI0018D3A696|nr:prenyltransferase/squalene oxidase repeat-containing protein [Botrimarina colliarenosi]
MAESATPPPEATADEPYHAGGRESYGWLASFALHAMVFLVLAWSTLPPLPLSTTFSLQGEPPPAERIDEAIDLDDVSFDLATDDLSQPLAASAPPLAAPTPDAMAASPTAAVDLSTLLADSAIASPTDVNLSVVAGVGTDGRSDAGKAALVAAKGGSPASEAAVARGLKWMAEHQNPDGTWSLVHNVGACRGRCDHPGKVPGKDPFGDSLASATGLALLPFLGAGETHEHGRYRRVIRNGLRALVRLGEIDEDNPGLSWSDSGRMYAHGISAIALCEAYGLTKDPDLRAPAQAAIAYLAYAQDPQGGGWRYTAQQPGDTSVTGWQIMALKSGVLASLQAPKRVASRATAFLDSASTADGTRYGYLAAPEPVEGEEAPAYNGTPTLSAVGLLCRMYLGWDQSDERLKQGVERLAKEGPRSGNFYHNYYAAQAIFHHTGGVGPVWREWNDAVRDQLVEQQSTRGHERGSWWVEGPHNDRGGRLYTTAMATMTLEVYYRYLPLYQSEAVNTALPD